MSSITPDESDEILKTLDLTIPEECADIFVRGITYVNYQSMGYEDITISYYKIEFDGIDDYPAIIEANLDLTADHGIAFDAFAQNNYKFGGQQYYLSLMVSDEKNEYVNFSDEYRTAIKELYERLKNNRTHLN